jgi:hypothetical protein
MYGPQSENEERATDLREVARNYLEVLKTLRHEIGVDMSWPVRRSASADRASPVGCAGIHRGLRT